MRHRLQRRRALAFYRPLVPSGGLVFDVGANLGRRTEVFRRLGARVVAVEPQPRCVDALRAELGADPNVVIEPVGVGPPGTTRATLHVPRSHTIASMSPAWIDAVRSTERFDETWADEVEVDVVTLDALIDRHGVPDFCKVDVEGFELEVLNGLSRPLPGLSFEFVPEYSDAAAGCVERLTGLGMTAFNASLGETFELVWPSPVDATRIVEFLRSLPPGTAAGDVYAAVDAG